MNAGQRWRVRSLSSAVSACRATSTTATRSSLSPCRTEAVPSMLSFHSAVARRWPIGHQATPGRRPKQADGSWSGPGTLDGVRGTLTMTGAPDPSTDAVEFESKEGFRNLHWTWVASKRRVAGCSRERIIIRPHGVLLWDGGGKITKTSLRERKYLGRKVGVYGPTNSSDPGDAQISIHE